jgi:transcription initiation factor TFIIIB Brf1 subunit/transcription initiation factor TFIIB
LEGKFLKKMQGITQQNVSAVRHTLNEQKKYNTGRLSSKKVLSYASKVWQGQQLIVESIAAETSQIIKSVNKRSPIFFSGKSEKRILSGIFYLLGTKKAKKTQREIARSLNTNDVTVRASYRDWLENFPDLFSAETNHLNNHSQ